MKENHKTWVIVSCSVINTFLTSGVIYGYPSLYPALTQSGVYHHLCKDSTSVQDVCAAQDSRLTVMYTVGCSLSNSFGIFFGLLLDKFGPRLIIIVASFLFALGVLLFAASSPSFDAYIPGFVLISIAGPGMYTGGLTLAHKFPDKAGLIIAFHSCAFDASAIVFWCFNQLYFLTSQQASIDLLFYFYCFVPVLSFCSCFFLFSSQPLKNSSMEACKLKSLPAGYDASANSLNEEIPGENPPEKAASFDSSHSEVDFFKHKSFRDQFFSLVFVFFSLTICMSMLILNFYVATIPLQLKHLYGNNTSRADQISNNFTVILALGAIFLAPLVGYILDKSSMIFSLFICAFSVIIFQFFATLSIYSPIEWITILCFTFARAIYYSATSTFISLFFGFETFGKIYGFLMFFSGSFNLASIGLAHLGIDILKGDFFYINLGLSISSCFTILFFFYMKHVTNHSVPIS